jgi:hypothetical protein
MADGELTKRGILTSKRPDGAPQSWIAKDGVPRHPEYDWHLPDWSFFLNAYEGGRNFTSNPLYLFTHQREDAEDRAFRMRRVAYYNYARSVVDLFTSHLYRREVTRETESRLYTRFLDDSDGRGTSIASFMRTRVAPMAFVLGMAYVVVDRQQAAAEFGTLAEEIEAGALSYATLVLPQDVVNWSEDATGALEWIVIRESSAPAHGPADAAPAPACRYRVWTRDRWFLLDEDGSPLSPPGPEGAEHSLGRVPVVRVYNERSVLHPGMGVSLIADIAPISRRIYNLSSLLDEFLYKQCFSFLAWPGEITPETIGANNVAQFDPQSGASPLYVSPPTDPAAFLESQIEKNVAEIFRLARLEYASVGAESGVAKAYDFHDASSVLARKAAAFERAEEEIADVFFLWVREEPRCTIAYPREFAVRSLDKELEESMMLISAGISEKFSRKLKKQLVRKVLPNLPARDAAEIDREIDGVNQS